MALLLYRLCHVFFLAMDLMFQTVFRGSEVATLVNDRAPSRRALTFQEDIAKKT